jgi:DNA-binding NarL/FixJ family response regulator
MKLNELNPTPIKVLIADDHPPFAEGLLRLLKEQTDLEPVGIAIDGEEAVRLAMSLNPDVVVMDISMPKMNGIKATKKIKNSRPNTAILMLSAYGYDPYVSAALEAGAGGYLLKNVPLRQLLDAIRALCVGETVIDQAIAAKLLRSISRSAGNNHVSHDLTNRELEVLRLGARGMSNSEIGKNLSISERTVQSNFTNIFSKLGVGSRIEAIVRSLKDGYLSQDDL